MGNSDYVSFLKEIARFIPDNRIYTDDLRRLAWGTDAGFYRLVPKIVVRSDNEQEISQILLLSGKYHIHPAYLL